MSSATKWDAGVPADTPYRRAGQEWDRRMGTAVVQARSWRLATFASLGAVCLSTAGLVYLGAQPKVVPHVIEVDHLGAVSYRGPAGTSHYTPPDAVLIYHLHRFVSDTRELSSDIAVVKQNWLDAYALVTPHGGNMLTAYVGEHDPFARAKEMRVTVEFRSTVRVSADTWQVDWRESSWDKNGNPSGPAAEWRAMLRTVLDPPKTPEAMAQNPLGLFVDEFHWDQIRSEAR